MSSVKQRKYRLLVVDDNRAIHDDFRKILAPDSEITQLDAIEADLFGKTIEVSDRQDFQIDSAYQGQQGLESVKAAIAEGRPYALAFIDMRMPPGWNGIETIEQIWRVDPDQQVVICSAYSDHSWAEISKRLGNSDRLLILKKPFDNVEILQMAYAMSRKCDMARQLRHQAPIVAFRPAANDDLGVARARDLLGSVKELKESVEFLQKSFEELRDRLISFRREMTAKTADPSTAALAELESTMQSAALEQRIPDLCQRLEDALRYMGQTPSASLPDKKPMR